MTAHVCRPAHTFTWSTGRHGFDCSCRCFNRDTPPVAAPAPHEMSARITAQCALPQPALCSQLPRMMVPANALRRQCAMCTPLLCAFTGCASACSAAATCLLGHPSSTVCAGVSAPVYVHAGQAGAHHAPGAGASGGNLPQRMRQTHADRRMYGKPCLPTSSHQRTSHGHSPCCVSAAGQGRSAARAACRRLCHPGANGASAAPPRLWVRQRAAQAFRSAMNAA